LNRALIILYIGFSSFGFSQKNAIDSLKLELKKTNVPIKQCEIFVQLSEAFGNQHPDSVVSYSLKAEKLIFQKKIVQEKKLKTRALEVLATAYNNIGFAYSMQSKLKAALKFHRKSLSIWEQLGDDENSSMVLNNIGVLYRSAGDFNMAQIYYDKALKTLEKQKDTLGIALCLNNLGGIYKEQGNYKKALSNYQTSLHLRSIKNDQNGIASTLNNIGALYKIQKNLDSASWYFNKSLVIVEKQNNIRGISHASYNLAGVEFEKGNKLAAKLLAQTSLESAKKISSISNIIQSSELLAKIHISLGEWKQASEMQTMFIENSKKIQKEELNHELIKSEYKSEYEKQVAINKKETEKKLAETSYKEAIRNFIFGATVLFLFLVIIFALILKKRLKILREQKEIIERQNNEREGLLQEIHHRVKNNFQIISSLLRLQSYNEKNQFVDNAFQGAINRIHAMSVVHEIIYKQGSFSGMSAKKYLDSLIDNLKKSLASDRLIIDVESFESELQIDQFIPIGIIINELITNSYQHAFTNDHENPRITISLVKSGDLIELNYKDNGIGFSMNKNDNSFGMNLIETMVDQISGKMIKTSDEQWKTIFKIQFEK